VPLKLVYQGLLLRVTCFSIGVDSAAVESEGCGLLLVSFCACGTGGLCAFGIGLGRKGLGVKRLRFIDK